MTFEEFKQIVLRLNANRIYYDGLNKYPSTYSTLIVSDEYVNDTAMVNNFLLQLLLPDHYNCLTWFLWDWKPGFSVIDNGIEYVIHNIDDYLKFKQETWV